MKKLIVTIAALVMYSGAIAQSKFEIGLHTAKGVNLTSEKHYSEGKPKTNGFSVGVRTNYSLTPAVDLQAGLLYTRMSMGQVSYGWCGTPPVPTVEVLSENMELQTAFRYKFRSDKRLVPFVSAGASQVIKYRQTTREKVDDVWLGEYSGIDRSTLKVALLASAGVKFKLNEQISVDVEHALKYFVYSDASSEKQLNPAIGLTLNYRLPN